MTNVPEFEFVAHYNLERSENADGTFIHMFGRTDVKDWGHVSIMDYGNEPGPVADAYYDMKLLVIKDLTSLKGLPVVARSIRNRLTGIHTIILPGYTRRLRDDLAGEITDETLLEDDVVVIFDGNTDEKRCQCGTAVDHVVIHDFSDCYDICRDRLQT